VLVLGTLGAAERRGFRDRKGRVLDEAEPAPVPTSRATLIRPQPFASREQAESWLEGLRSDDDVADAELADAARRLAGVQHAQRVAAADPYVPEADPDKALVVRIGFASGDQAVEGRYASAWELPRGVRRRAKRSMEAPEERFAGILGARERVLACEALVLRARADLDAGRSREAALQARVALEALLAELPRANLAGERQAVGDAANAALRGELPPAAREALTESVGRMETALKRRRLGA
jgi:hypothetical protein